MRRAQVHVVGEVERLDEQLNPFQARAVQDDHLRRAQDNNSGTFIIQSERMMQALTGLGKPAALYIYPFESHAPRAIENFLDLWARWLEWFDKYVKNAPAGPTTTSQQ